MATNISSIGTARDYSTVAAWEAATGLDLVTNGDIEVGEWHDDQDWTTTQALVILGATTDASNYRVLRAASGDEYDPVANTGLWWTKTENGQGITIGEANFRFGPGIGIERTYSGATSGARVLINVNANGDNFLIERCYLEVSNDGTYDNTIVVVRAASGAIGVVYRNVIVSCKVGTKAAPDVGLRFADDDCEMLNCVVYDAAVSGISNNADAGATGMVVENCISMSSGTSDFAFGSGTYATNDYNCSDDASATGANSITSQTDTDIFEDPTNNDFTLKSGSNAIDDGADLSGQFTDDFDGTTRSGTWDMGAYHAAVAGAPAPFIAREPTNVHLRR